MIRVWRPLTLCCVLLYAFIGSTDQEESTPLEVVKVTPLGGGVSTTMGRITIEFNKPMLALGERFQEFNEIPIEITPSVACTWRAFSMYEFTCLLDDDLLPETTYTIKVLGTAESLDGSVLTNGHESVFTTVLLAVEQDWMFWKSLPKRSFDSGFLTP